LKKSRRSVNTIRRKREPLIQVPQTQLTFHLLAERNAFRVSGSRLKSFLIAGWQMIRPGTFY
jgi:hypothetical protein